MYATYTLPYSTYVPLISTYIFGCTSYYLFPIQHMQPPSHPNPHHRGRGDTMNTLHTQPPPAPTHTPHRGGQNLDIYIYTHTYIYILNIHTYAHMYTKKSSSSRAMFFSSSIEQCVYIYIDICICIYMLHIMHLLTISKIEIPTPALVLFLLFAHICAFPTCRDKTGHLSRCFSFWVLLVLAMSCAQ